MRSLTHSLFPSFLSLPFLHQSPALRKERESGSQEHNCECIIIFCILGGPNGKVHNCTGLYNSAVRLLLLLPVPLPMPLPMLFLLLLGTAALSILTLYWLTLNCLLSAGVDQRRCSTFGARGRSRAQRSTRRKRQKASSESGSSFSRLVLLLCWLKLSAKRTREIKERSRL